MRQFSQSIHLKPDTKEGCEILSVVLAIPPRQRGALVRAVLAEHIRSSAQRWWPGLLPKTDEEIKEYLANRPTPRSSRRITVPYRGFREPIERPVNSDPGESLQALDVDATLDRLRF